MKTSELNCDNTSKACNITRPSVRKLEINNYYGEIESTQHIVETQYDTYCLHHNLDAGTWKVTTKSFMIEWSFTRRQSVTLKDIISAIKDYENTYTLNSL